MQLALTASVTEPISTLGHGEKNIGLINGSFC